MCCDCITLYFSSRHYTGFPVDVTFTRVLAAKELKHIELQLGQGAAHAPMEGAAALRLRHRGPLTCAAVARLLKAYSDVVIK